MKVTEYDADVDTKCLLVREPFQPMEPMEKSKIAVSGSSGFIGSHLVRLLRSMGNFVYTISRDELEHGSRNLKALKPDYVIHLAAYGNHYGQTEKLECLKSNVEYLGKLLSLTEHSGRKLFVNCGSSSEYGYKDHPMRENESLEPNGNYALTKAMGTLMAGEYARRRNQKVLTIRPFSVYGPGEAEHRFIPTVIRSLVTGEAISVHTEPKHDWIHVEDFCSGIVKAIKTQTTGILNIGTGMQWTNGEIVSTLEQISGKMVTLNATVMKRPNDTTSNWVADNSKLRGIGWVQQHDIASGLIDTYRHYNKAYEKPRT